MIQKQLKRFGLWLVSNPNKDNDKRLKALEKDSHPAQEYICCRKCGCEIAKTKVKKRR
tara:strand:- start:2725 stop:2898 length:174 start_codon:yes stop_codon:yes gene_type:complete